MKVAPVNDVLLFHFALTKLLDSSKAALMKSVAPEKLAFSNFAALEKALFKKLTPFEKFARSHAATQRNFTLSNCAGPEKDAH